ncbi:hypothetical protein QAD02_009108, partial [Eretmocerus hayati]
MADVRLLVQEEGRTARNLIAFNVPLANDFMEKITRKPPSVPKLLQSNSSRSLKSNARVRSASTGRDKRSELQARYWAFLFGNLQRAVDAIYETCEQDENISECKEVILVLENYIRDFHNLIEWFKVKWAYETSPPPLRRTPLAWEVRKTSPCRMWTSSTSKPGSPLPRLSPTIPLEQTIIEHKICTVNSLDSESDISAQFEPSSKPRMSPTIPLEQTIIEHKICTVNVVDNKSDITAKSEPSTKNSKLVKEVKNQGSKNEAKVLKEKPAVSKINSRSNNVKRPPTAKIQDSSECKILTENSINLTKVISDVKSTNVIKNSPRTPQVTINRPKLNESQPVNVNNENVNDGAIKKTSDAKKDVETSKNQMNSSTNKNVTPNGPSNAQNCPNRSPNKLTSAAALKSKQNSPRPAYSTISRMKSTLSSTTSGSHPPQQQPVEAPKLIRSKTTLGVKSATPLSTQPPKIRPGTSVIVRRRMQAQGEEDPDGWQTVRSRYRRGSSHNLNMSTRFSKPSTAVSLPALACLDSAATAADRAKKGCATPDGNTRQKQRRSLGSKIGKNINNEAEKVKTEAQRCRPVEDKFGDGDSKAQNQTSTDAVASTNSTSMTIAAIFKNEAELLEKRIQQFMAAQAERERIILEEERKTEEADSQRSKQLSDEEASLQRQILELESTEIDVDTETEETDGEMVLDVDEDLPPMPEVDIDDSDMSLEDRYGNMLEGMSGDERMDTLAQLQDLVARHPGRALELHQKLSSPSRKRSLPETLKRYQAKQACAQHKRQKLLMEKSQRLRELLNKVEDVKTAKNQLIEDKRIRLEMKLKRAEENRTQHLLEIVRKAHDEESKLKEIAFINELEAQNKRHDFMALCQEQEERLQGIHEERQRRQEEKAAKEAAAEERRRALEAERQLRIQKMRQARREREERVGKMQLEREKERQELAREKARDREERLSALHAAQLANQEELQKKIAQKQQESARRHVENIEHIRQRALESSIMRAEEMPPILKRYPSLKQCTLCDKTIANEVQLLSHLKSKVHTEAVRRLHDGREPCRDELQKFNISQIKDLQVQTSTGDENKAAKEKQKALKRRSRKIKQRMTARSQEYEDLSQNGSSSQLDSANKAKFKKNLKEIDKLCQSHAKTPWPITALSSLDRCLGEISRSFSKSCQFDQDTFMQLGGFDTLTSLLNLALNVQNTSQVLPNKSIVSICRVYTSAVSGHNNNMEAVLLSSKLITILDLMLQRLEVVTSADDNSQVQEISSNASWNGNVVVAAMQLLCALIPEIPHEKTILQTRLQDMAGFLMTSGLIDRICRHSRAMIETDYLVEQERDCPLLVASYDLLYRICINLKRTNTHHHSSQSVHDVSSIASGETCESNNSSSVTIVTTNGNNGNSEPSSAQAHLLTLLSATEGAGVVGALYAAVALTSATNQKGGSSPTPSQSGLSNAAKSLTWRGLRLLRSIAELDLNKLQ